MSKVPNRRDFKPETAGVGSESLKVSSVQDYTSGEGLDERTDDRELREQMYGAEGGRGD